MCQTHVFSRSEARVRYKQGHTSSIFPGDSNLYAVFDRYGRLKRRFCRHGAQKGSGVWDSELDYDDILWIKDLDIRSSLKEQERFLMARMLVAAVLGVARREHRKFFAVVASLEDNERAWEEDVYHRGILPRDQEFCAPGSRFWQLHRFRRIGLSPFLAFTDDTNHPSRALVNDLDFPGKRATSALVEDWMSDSEVLLLSGRSLDFDVLLIGLTEDIPTPSWTWADSEGMTILHYAARSTNVFAVDYFMRAFPPLIEMRDMFNKTPLDILVDQRDIEGALYRFDEAIGLPDWDWVTCMGMLTNIEIYQPLSLQDFDYQTDTMAMMKTMDASHLPTMTATLRIIFGCTCGSCIFGAISPRMSYQLLYHARRAATIWPQIWWHVFRKFGRVSSILYSTCLRRTKAGHNITRAEQRIFAAAVETIVNWFIDSFTGELLARDGTMGSTILSQAPASVPEAADYLHKESLEFYVIKSIFEMARKTDEWVGNGKIMEKCGDEIRALPECVNDSEYEHLFRRYLQYIRTIERTR